MTRIAKLLTELVGTFIFLSVIALSGSIGTLAPLAIGSVLMVMVYMGGHISGAHYNPAVSLGLFLRQKLGAVDLGLYWVAQLLGAALAFTFGYLVSGRTPGIHPGPHVGIASALAVEIAFTAALVLVVLNVAATRQTQGNSFYGLAIGFTIVVAAFAGGPLSGGAYNPAVGFGATFGSALFDAGSWSDLWLYIVGPLAGAAVGAGIHYVQVLGLELATAPPEREPSPGAPAPVPSTETPVG
ncbi:MAG: aquaporin [Candidatus Dormibacteraeota bacterium]|nr:aquaporin [Candidatus Dormibacteraeota bacterium]